MIQGISKLKLINLQVTPIVSLALLVASCCLFPLDNAQARKDSVYTVAKVRLDASADNAVLAKKKALLEGDAGTLGNLMNENHKLLQEITVSGEINDKLVDLAIKNGAIGAKITGTGRGGLVIALVKDEEQQEKIAQAAKNEGYDAWKTMIG